MIPPFHPGQSVTCRAFTDAATGKAYPAEHYLTVERAELVEHPQICPVWFVAAGNVRIRIDAPADLFALTP